MIVKVLQHKNGKYLKDYELEAYPNYDFLSNKECVGLMGFWLTDEPREAMHFYTSISAIVARNWVGNKFNYKNVEI